MKKILIVEDDKGIAQIERDYLTKEGFEVINSYNGKDALEKFKQGSFDLVVLDLNIPEISGIEVCKKIRETSGIPIIMVTAKTEETDEILGLNIGADDYVKKPFSPRVLVSRIKALLKRPEISSSSVLKFDNLEIDPEKQSVKKDNQQIPLTVIQFNILFLMASHPGKVFTRYDLIDNTYPTSQDSDIFDRTIDSHIKNIRKAIEDNSRKPKYILTVRGKGYKFNENI